MAESQQIWSIGMDFRADSGITNGGMGNPAVHANEIIPRLMRKVFHQAHDGIEKSLWIEYLRLVLNHCGLKPTGCSRCREISRAAIGSAGAYKTHVCRVLTRDQREAKLLSHSVQAASIEAQPGSQLDIDTGMRKRPGIYTLGERSHHVFSQGSQGRVGREEKYDKEEFVACIGL